MAGDLAVVFGGSGFVGRNVVRELARRGWRVRVAVRRPHHAQFLRTMGAVGQIHLAQTNLRHAGSVAEALKGADAVVNCVGILHQDGAQSFAAVQAGGAASLARLAAEAGAPRFVHVSAIGADETSASLYARSKGEGERAVRAALPFATIIRPSIVFGPEDQFFNRFATMFSLAPSFAPIPILIGGGETKFQPVYVDDVADAVCEALAGPGAAGKTYELGGPHIYSFKELLQMLMSQTGQRRILAPVPFSLAPALGFVGECLGLLPFFAPPITRDQIRLLKADNVVATGALSFADLGLAPKAVEAILPATWRVSESMVSLRSNRRDEAEGPSLRSAECAIPFAFGQQGGIDPTFETREGPWGAFHAASATRSFARRWAVNRAFLVGPRRGSRRPGADFHAAVAQKLPRDAACGRC